MTMLPFLAVEILMIFMITYIPAVSIFARPLFGFIR